MESQIEKPKNSIFKIFMQYLLSPILIIIVAVIGMFELDKYNSELKDVKKSQDMFSNLLTNTKSNDKLLEEVLQDERLKEEIKTIVDKYVEIKLTKFEEKQKMEVEKSSEIIKKNENEDLKTTSTNSTNKVLVNTRSKYEIAKVNEEEGFLALIKEDYNLAIEKFKKAYITYPTYHSVFEIYNLLLKNRDELKNKQVKEMVIDKIIKDYYWKIPIETLNELKKKIGN